MRIALLLLLAYGLGFVAAIPIGATQVEIARRAIADHMTAALMVVLGSVASDMGYGAVALFGLAPLLEDRTVMGYFGLAGAVLLWGLAFYTFRHAASAGAADRASPVRYGLGGSLLTGFSLAVTNPPIMFWWLVGAKLAVDLGLARRFTPHVSAAFLAAGGLGLASYLSLLSFLLRRIKHMIVPETEHRLYTVLGVLLVAISLYMLATALRDLRVW